MQEGFLLETECKSRMERLPANISAIWSNDAYAGRFAGLICHMRSFDAGPADLPIAQFDLALFCKAGVRDYERPKSPADLSKLASGRMQSLKSRNISESEREQALTNDVQLFANAARRFGMTIMEVFGAAQNVFGDELAKKAAEHWRAVAPQPKTPTTESVTRHDAKSDLAAGSGPSPTTTASGPVFSFSPHGDTQKKANLPQYLTEPGFKWLAALVKTIDKSLQSFPLEFPDQRLVQVRWDQSQNVDAISRDVARLQPGAVVRCCGMLEPAAVDDRVSFYLNVGPTHKILVHKQADPFEFLLLQLAERPTVQDDLPMFFVPSIVAQASPSAIHLLDTCEVSPVDGLSKAELKTTRWLDILLTASAIRNSGPGVIYLGLGGPRNFIGLEDPITVQTRLKKLLGLLRPRVSVVGFFFQGFEKAEERAESDPTKITLSFFHWRDGQATKYAVRIYVPRSSGRACFPLEAALRTVWRAKTTTALPSLTFRSRKSFNGWSALQPGNTVLPHLWHPTCCP
eukprot:TRINITY_DN2087_c0_g1_i3.p1 TRINITY_DN2087_c0_g1~~TRINITY_DN2087_c0_g1_i3.p1  ORF type:complete len:515 (+),score=51.95 TRINITY_DN2087_c0_g1_i3:407-1951(+)